MVKCKEKTCKTLAIFGIPNTKRGEYCAVHKPDNYVNVRDRKCLADGCIKHPTYGLPGTKNRKYCVVHAPANYINVKALQCIKATCTLRPNYGVIGTKKGEYCRLHAPPNYIDVLHRQCLEKNCKKRPCYGIAGSKNAQYCTLHAPENYIDVANRKCIQNGCTIQPRYGIPGTKTADYCKAHTPDNYIDVTTTKCFEPNCTNNAYYGLLGSNITKYCKLHAPANYFHTYNGCCLEEHCTIIPTYGLRGTKITEYCATHAPTNYVNISKQCLADDCTTYPSFGPLGTSKRDYCAAHAPDDYVNTCKKRLCVNDNCTKLSYYGIPGYSPEFCVEHKNNKHVRHPSKYKDGFITCGICDLKVHYTKEYCTGCQKYLLEGMTVKRKNKELAIKNLLESHEIIFEHDRQIKNGKSRKRPDFHIPTKWGSIIIEVDEFQHIRKSYSCECEITRMKQIYFDINKQQPLLFIRYNPDKYVQVPGEKKYIGKWRQGYLIKYLQQMIQSEPECNLGVVYLFYDNFLAAEPEIEIIEPYLQK